MTTDEKTARSYSNVALAGAIRSLERMQWRGEWGDRRLRALNAEQNRREHPSQPTKPAP